MSDISLSEAIHQLMHSYTHLLLEGIRRQKIELSVTNIRALKNVCHNSQNTAHSVAKHMQRDKAQITRALNDLMDAELILKKDNPLDGRSQLLECTAKGKAVMVQLDAAEDWAVEQLTQDLKGDELALFLRVSSTMVNSTTNSHTTSK